jgi:ribonuclease HI
LHFISPVPEDQALGSLPFETSADFLKDALILLDEFTTDQQDSILWTLTLRGPTNSIIVCPKPDIPQRRQLERIADKVGDLLPGQELHSFMGSPRQFGQIQDPPDWATGNLQMQGVKHWYQVWQTKGTAATLPSHEWHSIWRSSPHLTKEEFLSLRQAAQQYWQSRQDGFTWTLPPSTVLAATDGSVKTEMGAAAVIQLSPTEALMSFQCKVGGAPSSFRAELAAISMALINSPKHQPLVIMTDSMNAIQALHTWGHQEYFRDMERQKNADIVRGLLEAINHRSAHVHIVKVKSHRGVQLNEIADSEANAAAQADPEATADSGIPILFDSPPEHPSFSFTWWEDPDAEESTTTKDWREVRKRWTQAASRQALDQARAKPTLASAFLLNDSFNLHLLRESQLIQAWTPAETRRWMQMVSRVFPVNAYLHRIGAHPTGECPWCRGKRETLTHFQSECVQFQTN